MRSGSIEKLAEKKERLVRQLHESCRPSTSTAAPLAGLDHGQKRHLRFVDLVPMHKAPAGRGEIRHAGDEIEEGTEVCSRVMPGISVRRQLGTTDKSRLAGRFYDVSVRSPLSKAFYWAAQYYGANVTIDGASLAFENESEGAARSQHNVTIGRHSAS
jgi:hypothetical protein